MPITINGSGTVTGVSVGGLPDGIVDTDMLANGAVTATKRGAGAILQVVQFRKTDTFSSSNNGFVDIGVAVDITPIAAGSKILIYAGYSGYTVKGSGGAGKIVRTIGGSAQDIGKADAASARNVSSFSGHLYTADGSNSNLMSLAAHTQLLDTPTYSVGNTINYKIQCHPENHELRINYQENDVDNTGDGNRTTSYITCMEVAA
tara:strand:- start:653 stop:1264 length:612 start_codon:yes stop_codon:yes gene_type:complete